MSEFKGTKGNWYHDAGISKAIFHPTEVGLRLALVDDTYNEHGMINDEYKYNSQLIAHAPQMLDILKQIDYTLSVHGKVDAGTNLHIRLAELIQQATTIK